MLDTFKDECGVFGIYGHAEASNLAYLGLYALQHRGQEASGIVSGDGRQVFVHKGKGLVADIYSPHVLGQLIGSMAIGLATGEVGRTLMQPFTGDLFKGKKVVLFAVPGAFTNE